MSCIHENTALMTAGRWKEGKKEDFHISKGNQSFKNVHTSSVSNHVFVFHDIDGGGGSGRDVCSSSAVD